MKKILFLLFFSFVFLKAEFVSSFDQVPPATETILGEQIQPQGVQTPTSSVDQTIMGEEIQAGDIQIPPTVYKEVSVEDYIHAGPVKIALLVPKRVIKGYAKKVSNSILSYLIFKGDDFTFEVFDSKDESADNLINTISKIRSKGYNYVVAVLTEDGTRTLAAIERDMLIYVPTINKKVMISHGGNFYFGGIDYEKQIDKLMPHTNGKLAIFMDKSRLAQQLTQYIQNKSYNSYIYTKLITNAKKTNPKYILKGNTRLQNASIFFNMPLVSTALLASSFSSYNIKPYALLSTQVNYSPLLFSMIQRKDRQNFYIANSIGYVNSKLNDINQNLGIKIKYEWVPYSASIGVDYILSRYYGVDPTFNEDMRSHQIRYRTKVEKIVGDEFKRAN